MSESNDLKTVHELSSQLDTKLKITDAKSYNDALDQIMGRAAPEDVVSQLGAEQVEKIITRSYQDHSESRKYLHDLILQDLPRALDTFEELSSQTVYTLAGSFPDAESTLPLLSEIRKRVHYGEDRHVKYLLSLLFKLLTDFKYEFNQVSFLIRELCGRTKEEDVKSIMLLIFSQMEKQYQKKFNDKLLDFIDALVIEAESDVGNDSLSLIVEILTELYPVLTALCSEIFLGSKLAELFQKRVLDEADVEFTKSLLRLFSIACIDETVRVHIAENYISLLERSLALNAFKIYSVLVLIKTWSFSKLQNVSVTNLASILVDGFIDQKNKNDDEIAACIEGLAYLSLKPAVKKILRSKELFCSKIVELINAKLKDSNSYGALVILANLSTHPQDYNASGNFDSKSIRDLKTYYELKNPTSEEKEANMETKEEVVNFNTNYVLNKEVISTAKTEFASSSQGSRQQFVRIIYNVTRDRPSISKCIGQGGTTLILEYLLNDHDKTDVIRILASRALTKMLIFTDPTLIFTKYSPVNAIGPLFDLLPKLPAESQQVFETKEDHISTTDSYEALLALTNLASFSASEGEDVCKRIATVDKYWTVVENLMLDENILLQRSTLELISNLMSHPLPIAAKFFNFDNPRSVKNFDVLVKLLQLNDVNSQRAVAAIFANITNTIPFIAQDLLTKKELIDKAVEVLVNQLGDAELRQRLIILFYSLVEMIPQENPEQGSLLIGNKPLIGVLSKAAKIPDMDPDIAEVIPIILASIGSPA
ncbi:ZYRO0C11154p [Zygosaccharomyces rouxii]|uniref:ZYRO0C11154p n=1 Tax=Zygosaccharomyces rouxii (strain ATCC 2623 / CBS 732 / NBRC 1130 / NCYC 568 / NRRL Y-229) TaxID=559307 RepID=C5DTT4_ZYGRC|nr:uncharacterized protein ZYRO0C11154g [Zygosaccharomyces rouxii]KAH9201630.1 myosin-binding striated muscle assembly central-domain-containing protein [Zygosaccharomyces rouxii]CAR27195.1 ZYRO0C11154p [Zygosaccharomyces rouxii]